MVVPQALPRLTKLFKTYFSISSPHFKNICF